MDFLADIGNTTQYVNTGNEHWWIAAMFSAIGSFAAAAAAFFAWKSVKQTKKGVWAQIVMQLKGEYSSSEMGDGIKRLRDFKDKWGTDFNKAFTRMKKEKKEQYDELNEDRRRYSHYFHKIRSLLETDVVDKKFVKKVIHDDQVERLLDIVEPLEKEINSDYDPSTFQKFSELYKIPRSLLVNGARGKEQDMSKENIDQAFKLQKFVLERFYSFLVATAFLVAAFAAVEVKYTETNNNSLLLLAYTVNAVGLYLATYFTVANYHGALTISDSLKDNKPSAAEVNDKDQPHKLLWSLICSLYHLLFNPFSMRVHVVHTWLIPFFFCLVWLTTWFGILPVKPVSSGVAIGLPVSYLIVLGIGFYIKSKRKPKLENKDTSEVGK